jgi:hypothetical protein
MEWDTTALENIRWLRGVYMILYRHKTVETKVKKSNDYPLNLKHACKLKQSDSSFVNKISGKKLDGKMLY